MALAAREERAGLGERYGVAVNASSLEIGDGRDTPLDRIVEMGYARIGMAHAAANDADRVAGELAPWLWRAAYGADRGLRATSERESCTRFAAWLMLKPYLAEIDLVDPGIVRRFAAAIVHEWLSLRCAACGGGGWQGVTKHGKRVLASALGRGAMKAICLQCRGSGRPKESPKLRARVLGSEARKISNVEYFLLWRRQFSIGLIDLKKISERPRDHLHAARYSV